MVGATNYSLNPEELKGLNANRVHQGGSLAFFTECWSTEDSRCGRTEFTTSRHDDMIRTLDDRCNPTWQVVINIETAQQYKDSHKKRT